MTSAGALGSERELQFPALPQTWTRARLDRVASVNARIGWKALTADEYQLQGYTFLATPNIKQNPIDFSNVNYITEDRYEESPELKLAPEDVLLAKDGNTLGICNIVRSLPRPATVNGSIAVIRPHGIDSRFLYYFISSEATQGRIHAVKAGMGVPHLFQADLKRFPIALPPPREQLAIADFLDRETTRVDALVEKRLTLSSRLAERRVAARRAVFGSETGSRRIPWLPPIPTAWDVLPLRWVARCLDGQRVPLNREQRADMPGEIPYWGSNGVVDFVGAHLFDEPLVLLGEDGSPFFEPEKDVSFYVEGKVWVNNHIHVLRPTGVRPLFLTHYLNAVDYSAFITGSTRDKLTQQEMGAIPVPVPPKKEQQEIERRIESEFSLADELVGKIRAQVDLLREHRQAFISAAVTGRLEIPPAA